MAAIVTPQAAQPEDSDLARFRAYVIERDGATHVTEKAVKAAFEAELANPYGREVLLAKIQAYETKRDAPYRIWTANPFTFSGYWRSNTTEFVLEALFDKCIAKQVMAKFPGAHFCIHAKTAISGKLYTDDSTIENLLGKHLAKITTTTDRSRCKCNQKYTLKIDWYTGTGNDELVASFISDDFPFEIAATYSDSESTWTEGSP